VQVVAFLARIKDSFSSTFGFFRESVQELKKVKWPTRKELISYTLVTVGTVAFIGVYFFLLDLGISELVSVIMG
jgi:preprotein translocase subunit SecE